MTEACKVIRNAVIQAQGHLAAHVRPGGPDAKATVSELLRVLDHRQLLEALAETATKCDHRTDEPG
jgi:hypothetical protein